MICSHHQNHVLGEQFDESNKKVNGCAYRRGNGILDGRLCTAGDEDYFGGLCCGNYGCIFDDNIDNIDGLDGV